MTSHKDVRKEPKPRLKRKSLNLLISVHDDDGELHQLYGQPVTREFFDRYYDLLAVVHAEVIGQYHLTTGPSLCLNILRTVAEIKGCPARAEEIISEILCTASVALPTEGAGLQVYPLEVAVNRGWLDERDRDFLLSHLVFFTCISHISSPSMARSTAGHMAYLWQWSTTSWSASEWESSLMTQPTPETSGERATASSQKSSTTQPEPDSKSSLTTNVPT